MKLYEEKYPTCEITSFYALSLHGYQMNNHVHKSCEIMYVLKGKCEVYVEDEKLLLEEHQFILLERDIPHRLYIPERDICAILNIEFGTGDEQTGISIRELVKKSTNFRNLCMRKAVYLVGHDSHNLGYALKDLISHLEKQTTEPCCGEDQRFLTEILFTRVLLECCECDRHTKAGRGVAYVRKAIGYMQEHLTEEIRIPQIAEACGINKSYLQLLFASQMHCTITEYMNRKRLEQAVFLLANSSLSVTDIGFQCGYNSRQHFGSTFEKFYQMSPKAYRQLHGRTLAPSTGQGLYEKKSDGSWKNAPLQ